MFETLVAKFFAIYFWAYIYVSVVNIAQFYTTPKDERPKNYITFGGLIALVLFIMSFSF